MIDWWGILGHALWVSGLALALAVLSLADYQAHREGVRLRTVLGQPGLQSALAPGLVLFCLGLLVASAAWWQRLAWGLLTLLFAGQAAWLWRSRPARLPPHGHVGVPPSGAAAGKGQRLGRLGWGLVLAGLLVIAGWGLFAGVQTLEHAHSLSSHLRYLDQLVRRDPGQFTAADLEGAGQALAAMRLDLEGIQAQVGPLLPLGRLFRGVPGHGGDLAAAPELLDMATRLATAGDRAWQALAPAVALAGDPLHGDPGRVAVDGILATLAEAEPELQAARQELAAAVKARDRLDAQRLSPQVAGLVERFDRYLPRLDTALDGALLAAGVLGGDGARTYLILAQNNHELRPTGGFISGVGELRIEDGRLASWHFDDSYAVDNPKVPHARTPPAVQQTLFGQLWYFRDANWDADFPTSARRALNIYARDRGVQAAGVLSLDLAALQSLVEAAGPLPVQGVAGPVTGENVLQVIQGQWAAPAPGVRQGSDPGWQRRRKDFMGQIADALLARLLAGQGVRPVALAQALGRLLDEKHMLVYLADPRAAGLLRRQNWDGALPIPRASDLLLVADSNVGFNKADANVSRSIHYQVDLGTGRGPRAQVTLTYGNHSPRLPESCVQGARYGETYADMTNRCYWNYARVYIPVGSRLLAGPDLPLPAGSLLAQEGSARTPPPIEPALDEGDWRAWAAFFDLAPGTERTLTFAYELPHGVLARDSGGLVSYRLRVQKQPGTGEVPLRVEIALPPGAQVVEATPAALLSPGETLLAVATDLRTDREFLVVYRQAGKPP